MIPAILEFSEKNFYDALTNPHCCAEAARVNRCASNLYTYLSYFSAQTIIVEEDYVDGDYVDDYALYYVKCFERYEIRCKRIHFFDRTIETPATDDFLALACSDVLPEKLTAFQGAYLGFIVARPLPRAIIGRTALKPNIPDAKVRHFPSLITIKANLLGIPLSVDSLAFQEQDKVVAACGTVALWSALQKSNHLFNTITPRPGAITVAANKVIGHYRILPSHALTLKQLCSAINHVGLEPEAINLRNKLPLRSILYAYLRLGLAPVVIVRIGQYNALHAIAINGYALNEDAHTPATEGRTEGAVPMRADRIDAFFGHDDQIGAYVEHRVISSKNDRENPLAFKSEWKSDSGKLDTIYPQAVVIPVYNKIRLNYNHVEYWLTKLNPIIAPTLGKMDYEWDLYLTFSNTYKRNLCDEGASIEVRRAVILRQHPRFLWRAVLYLGDKSAMEILFDATDIPNSFPGYCLIWHDSDFRDAISAALGDEEIQSLARTKLSNKFFRFLKEALEVETYFHSSARMEETHSAEGATS